MSGSGAGRARSGTETSLRAELESLILDTLLFYVGRLDRSEAWKVVWELSDPRKNQGFLQGSKAAMRMADYHEKIQTAQREGRVFPWIYTPGAAAAAEGVFESAFFLWLNAAPPTEENELPRSVLDWVSLQVGLLVAAIGGLR